MRRVYVYRWQAVLVDTIADIHILARQSQNGLRFRMLAGKDRMGRRLLTQLGKIGLSFGFVSLQYPNGPSVALFAIQRLVVGILAVILEDEPTELALNDSLDFFLYAIDD